MHAGPFNGLPELHYKYRVRTGPGKPGKSWNFVMAFSRTGIPGLESPGKKPLVVESSGNLLNSTERSKRLLSNLLMVS